jgi:hypothetical protein
MYHHVAPAGGVAKVAYARGLAVLRRMLGQRRAERLSPLAGLLLVLACALVVAAGPPDGKGHAAGAVRGAAAAAATHGRGESAEHAATAAAIPARTMPDPDEDTAESALRGLVNSVGDLKPPHHPQPTGSGGPPSTVPPVSGATPAPATTVAAALGPAAVPRRGPAAPGSISVPNVAWPNIQLIPPASLPAPATFVPASSGFGAGPVVGLAVGVLLIGGLLGLRIVRRS